MKSALHTRPLPPPPFSVVHACGRGGLEGGGGGLWLGEGGSCSLQPVEWRAQLLPVPGMGET